jgi:hypothetical protein
MSLSSQWNDAVRKSGKLFESSRDLLKDAEKMKQTISSEHNEQATFVDYVLWTYQHHDDFIRGLFFSVPNGAWLGGRAPAMMNKMKREGFLPGVADILYLQPRGGHTFLAIEMKTIRRRKEKNGGVSDEQMAFLQTANQSGALAVSCYGANEAIELFDGYMKLSKADEKWL